MSAPQKPIEKPGGRQKPDVKPPSDEKKVESNEDYIKAMMEIGSDLMFVGFSSERFRKNVRDKKVPALTVVKAVTAYVQIGNNVKNCVDKRRNRAREDIAQMLLGLNERPSRFAIAYLPVTLMVRRNLAKAGLLAPRFQGLTTSVILQDPAFTGWQGEAIRDFLIAFDKALVQTGDARLHGVDQVTRWIEISKAGFAADRELVEAMKTADDDSAVLAWLKSSAESI
jgi:hypothetical protein